MNIASSHPTRSIASRYLHLAMATSSSAHLKEIRAKFHYVLLKAKQGKETVDSLVIAIYYPGVQRRTQCIFRSIRRILA